MTKPALIGIDWGTTRFRAYLIDEHGDVIDHAQSDDGIMAVKQVQGLTTGAGMWLAGAVGLSCGFGLWQIAALGTALILVVRGLLHTFEGRLGIAADKRAGDGRTGDGRAR